MIEENKQISNKEKQIFISNFINEMEFENLKYIHSLLLDKIEKKHLNYCSDGLRIYMDKINENTINDIYFYIKNKLDK